MKQRGAIRIAKYPCQCCCTCAGKAPVLVSSPAVADMTPRNGPATVTALGLRRSRLQALCPWVRQRCRCLEALRGIQDQEA